MTKLTTVRAALKMECSAGAFFEELLVESLRGRDVLPGGCGCLWHGSAIPSENGQASVTEIAVAGDDTQFAIRDLGRAGLVA